MAQFGPFALVYVSMEPSAKTSSGESLGFHALQIAEKEVRAVITRF